MGLDDSKPLLILSDVGSSLKMENDANFFRPRPFAIASAGCYVACFLSTVINKVVVPQGSFPDILVYKYKFKSVDLEHGHLIGENGGVPC